MTKNKKNTVLFSTSIRDAVKKMDVEDVNSLFVIDNKNKVLGVFTMGDFRRAVLNGLDINNDITLLANKKFEYLFEGYVKNDAKKIFTKNNLIIDIPILNKKFQLVSTISRKNILSTKELNKRNTNLKKIPVVIMAGGKGTRMDPFTRVLPKPLIPFGNEPIIQIIMNNFYKFHTKNFYISINYMGKMIKAYFQDHDFPYNINFIDENKPLGTAGALKYLIKKINNTFFVSNCDVVVNTHYPSILDFHKDNNFDLTVVASLRNYIIPYGICDSDSSGSLVKIKEKPKLDFLVNTGLYVFEPKILELIPKNKSFDMNELINKAKKNNMKVGVFPISEKSWTDIGQWEEYSKILN